MSYLETTQSVYAKAAKEPLEGLCCTTTPVWQLPDLNVPKRMLRMNYGCGSTVHPRDLAGKPTILYVGVGGGLELLQFAYFSRQKASVIGVDPVGEMLEACRKNLVSATKKNDWFQEEFVSLREGDALELPIENATIDVAAQNCLFNIFKEHDLARALDEMYRVLRPHGRLVMSDPVCEQDIPTHLRNDEELRALCLTGVVPLDEYVNALTTAGFGTIEIRAKRPYRVLPKQRYNVEEAIYIESIEVCAIKDPMPADGPCVFTGRTAIYFGDEPFFDDGQGHTLMRDIPLAVCDKTAKALSALAHDHLMITPSTWFYDGGGCC